MKKFSKLKLICLSILIGIPSSVMALEKDTEIDNDKNETLNALNIVPSDSEFANLELNNNFKTGQILTSLNSGTISPVVKDSDIVNSDLSAFKVKLSSPSLKNVEVTENDNIIKNKSDISESILNTRVTEFYKKYKNPEILFIVECDGLTQTIHALNMEKALINGYYDRHSELSILNKIDKWVGISYGSTVVGANAGTLSNIDDVVTFNSTINNVIEDLKNDRAEQYKWYTCFSNCFLNCCIKSAKFKATAQDIEIIRNSQFDKFTQDAVEIFLVHYFPTEISSHLVLLETGKDRRRVDPDYRASYTAIINDVNTRAKHNNQKIIKNNITKGISKTAEIIDELDVPVIDKVASVVGKIAKKATAEIKLDPIENTKNCDAYQEMSKEVLAQGTLKLIINIDNHDGEETIPSLSVEHKPQENKLKFIFNISIPTTQYQDKNYNFNDGYDKILSYINNKKVEHYLKPFYDYIKNMQYDNLQ